MSPARLVVIEGPDLGRVFEIPPVGCCVGRGDGNLVKLGDPRVSRQHGRIEARAGGLFWIEGPAERTRTLVNGAPVTAHALVAGDEIVLGDRARRHLIAIALLGDRLRAETAAGRDAALAAACDAARAALDADRVFAISCARGTALAASGGPADFRAPHALVANVAAQRHVVTAERAGRAVIAAPIYGAADEVTAILWIERAASEPWPEPDVLAAGCIALVAGAAWTGADPASASPAAATPSKPGSTPSEPWPEPDVLAAGCIALVAGAASPPPPRIVSRSIARRCTRSSRTTRSSSSLSFRLLPDDHSRFLPGFSPPTSAALRDAPHLQQHSARHRAAGG